MMDLTNLTKKLIKKHWEYKLIEFELWAKQLLLEKEIDAKNNKNIESVLIEEE